jgi:hypothetical protein
LQDHGFTVIAVALDPDADAVREWATQERLTFPVLVDRQHIVAELYGFTNVPASVWIDEHGRVVRPADTAMGDDRFRAFTNVDSSVHHERLRRWVVDGVRDLDDPGVRANQMLPDDDTQRARLHRRVGIALGDRGDEAGRAHHLREAERLAPMDWTIVRGNMPLFGDDPFGDKFFEFAGRWAEAGSPGYPLGTGREQPGA